MIVAHQAMRVNVPWEVVEVEDADAAGEVIIEGIRDEIQEGEVMNEGVVGLIVDVATDTAEIRVQVSRRRHNLRNLVIPGHLDHFPRPLLLSLELQVNATSNLPGAWQFQQFQMERQHQFQFGAQQQFVQPHINPRFASQFGMNLGFMQPQFYPQYGQTGFGSNDARGSLSGGNWADQWTVHGGGSNADDANRDDNGTDHQPHGNP